MKSWCIEINRHSAWNRRALGFWKIGFLGIRLMAHSWRKIHGFLFVYAGNWRRHHQISCIYIYIYICTRGTSPFVSISLWRALPPTKPRAESVVAPSELSEVARAGDLSGHIEGGRALRREVNITKHLCHLAHNHIFLEFRTCIISFKKQMLIHSWLPDFDYLWLRAKRNL